MIIRTRAHPRAALIGNPSDGFFGKTIAFTFRNFRAEITLYETPELEIAPSTRDHNRFQTMRSMFDDIRRFGYYGGIRLIKAAIKRFFQHCEESGICIDGRNFTIRYTTDIPTHLGLAGSSAIITACFRALMQFYEVAIDAPLLANLILAAETEELGIPAGLQDRVAQTYDCPVYMDFDQSLMESRGYGRYEPIESVTFPPLYIAYRTELSEGSEVMHSNLRYRYRRGEPEVLDAMRFWAALTDQAREVLLAGEAHAKLGALLDQNFDMRQRICSISEGNRAMIDCARRLGASAKFTGSGGAIIGAYDGEEMYARLVEEMALLRVNVLRPVIQNAERTDAHDGA
jgi:glucuronokinase